MSGGTIILLSIIGVFIFALASFFYGFKLGVRAERTDWDLRRMLRSDKKETKVAKAKKLSDIELAINEELGFWQNEKDAVDSDFCDKYMRTLQHLRIHVNRFKRKSARKWEKMKPVWEDLDFERVTMNTCLNYDLSRDRVISNLSKLLHVVAGRSGAVNWSN